MQACYRAAVTVAGLLAVGSFKACYLLLLSGALQAISVKGISACKHADRYASDAFTVAAWLEDLAALVLDLTSGLLPGSVCRLTPPDLPLESQSLSRTSRAAAGLFHSLAVLVSHHCDRLVEVLGQPAGSKVVLEALAGLADAVTEAAMQHELQGAGGSGRSCWCLDEEVARDVLSGACQRWLGSSLASTHLRMHRTLARLHTRHPRPLPHPPPHLQQCMRHANARLLSHVYLPCLFVQLSLRLLSAPPAWRPHVGCP